MSDDKIHRPKVDFNDSLLTYNSPQNLIPRGRLTKDIRNKDVSSLSRRRSKGLKVSNTLSSGAIISPGRPVAVSIPTPDFDKYERAATNKLLKDINEEVNEVIEVELEYIKILNQTWLKPIRPLGKCFCVIDNDNNVSIMSGNKIVECFDFNLEHSVRLMYFRREKDFLFGEFVIIFNEKRQLTRTHLNLLNPATVPSRLLPKFDKVWFKAHKSSTFTKFHNLAVKLHPKTHHETIKCMNELFTDQNITSLDSPTSPSQFYGMNKIGSLLKARKDRAIDNDCIIETKPRTRSSTNHAQEKINTIETAEVIWEDDQHENIKELDQIRFKPDLNFKFEDKRTFTITNSDFKCLYNNSWINDNLIDFFLKLNLEAAIRQNHMKSDQVLLLNSFFFTKLVTNENYYDNVKSWFKDDKLFTYQYVIIPVNQDLHWYCLIIHNLDKVFEENKNDSPIIEGEENKIEIFILDSLNQDHRSIKTPLINFLSEFARERYDFKLSPDSFKMHVSPIPKQENFNDCGIHVIYNIDIFFNKTEDFKEIWKKSRKKFKNNKGLFLLTDRQNLRIKLREELIKLLQLQEKHNNLPDFEKTGTLTNKDYQDADTSKIEDDNEEFDSDFEILDMSNNQKTTEKNSKLKESNSNNNEVHSPTFPIESPMKEESMCNSRGSPSEPNEEISKYFSSSQLVPTSSDSALDTDINSFIEDLEVKIENSKRNKRGSSVDSSRLNDMSLLSTKLKENTISLPSLENFYNAINDKDFQTEGNIGKYIKYVKGDESFKLSTRVFHYLRNIENNVLDSSKFSDLLKWLLKYFNQLKRNEKPDKEVIVLWFGVFLETCESESENEQSTNTSNVLSEKEKEDVVDEEERKSTPESKDVTMISQDSDSVISHSTFEKKSSPKRPIHNVISFLENHRSTKVDQPKLPEKKENVEREIFSSEVQELDEEEDESSGLSDVDSDRIIPIEDDKSISISNLNKSINISDTEDYFNESVSRNREKFMSSFGPSEDNVQILEERILPSKSNKTRRTLKEKLEAQLKIDDESYTSSPALRIASKEPRRKGILEILPASNKTISQSRTGVSRKEDTNNKGKGYKKQKLNGLK